MDDYYLTVLGALALLGVCYVVYRRSRTKISYKDGKREVEFGASDPEGPKAVIRNATSRAGGAVVEDETGGGALLEDVHVAKDLVAKVSASQDGKKNTPAN